MNKPVNANQEFQSDFLSVTEARTAISAVIHSIQAQARLHEAIESLPLKECLGRILASDVLSPINVPANDNSAMDGFAFNGKELDTAQDPVNLRIAGAIYAGQTHSPSIQMGECIKVMTGAMMPPNCDTVIPQEFTKSSEEGSITFAKDTVRAGDNRRLCGEDLQAGKPAIQRGRILKASDIGLAASLGIAKLEVYQRIKVAILSSGDELCSIGVPLQPGKIYDSNRFSLHACLSKLGFEIIDCGIVHDTPDGKIAMRPGRPMAFGSLKPVSPKTAPTVFFGLPGNPVAVMVTFYQFVRNALLQLSGALNPEIPLVSIQSAEAIRKKSGRTEFQRGILFRDPEGRLLVKSTGSQGAGILRSMSEADCFMILHHHQGNIAPGDWVDVEIFDGLL